MVTFFSNFHLSIFGEEIYHVSPLWTSSIFQNWRFSHKTKPNTYDWFLSLKITYISQSILLCTLVIGKRNLTSIKQTNLIWTSNQFELKKNQKSNPEKPDLSLKNFFLKKITGPKPMLPWISHLRPFVELLESLITVVGSRIVGRY